MRQAPVCYSAVTRRGQNISHQKTAVALHQNPLCSCTAEVIEVPHTAKRGSGSGFLPTVWLLQLMQDKSQMLV